MNTVVVTGSLGLIGQACCLRLLKDGFVVIGIDNDRRKDFFGEEASVKDELEILSTYDNYIHKWIDICSNEVSELFNMYGNDIIMTVHCASQPSHDWAYNDPRTDFNINSYGTLNLLEATRIFCPNSMFVYMSTNKVYGDGPNKLELIEEETRYSVRNDDGTLYGIDETFNIDNCVHSIFGVNKLSADLMVQEYGKNLGIKSVVLRCGCLTGKSHKGAKLHGFLSYLSICVRDGIPYTIYGYKGKQVRDNIHAEDVVDCIYEIYNSDDCFGEVFNIGGSFESNISMIEAIDYFQRGFGKSLEYTIDPVNRVGDHIWYITDMSKFKEKFPNWKMRYTKDNLLDSFI